jgi:hypothetical protein
MTQNQLPKYQTPNVSQSFLLSSHFEMRRGQAVNLFSKWDDNKKLWLTVGVL